DVSNVTFQEETGGIPVSARTGTSDVAPFDVDGDGWRDLVIGTCAGTAVWISLPPFGINFTYPSGLPALVATTGPTEVQVELEAVGETLDPASPAIHVAVNGGPFDSTPMTHLGGNLYSASVDAQACLDRVTFYFSAQLSGGSVVTDPPNAPASTYRSIAADGTELVLDNDVEGDVSAWTILSDPSLSAGEWEQADPNATICCGGQLASPEDDATAGAGNTMAFVTENGPPGGAPADNDVDGGPTYLVSPVIDLTGTDAVITYQRWFFSDSNANDELLTEVSNDGGANWTPVSSVAGTGGAWQAHSFVVGDSVTPTADVQVRFSTADDPNDSITEAGIDDFTVDVLVCGLPCLTDLTGDGVTNVLDLIELLLCFGQPANPPCDAADVNTDGSVNVLDLIELLLSFGTSCP
ncbi:MAG: dockerin type I domain-containing protein, partial [Planctomycetota bacterium]